MTTGSMYGFTVCSNEADCEYQHGMTTGSSLGLLHVAMRLIVNINMT